MTANRMELNIEELQQVNGGFSPVACVLGTLFGAAKGALAGGALGLAAGPAGAVAGAFIGGIAGGAAEGYACAFMDEKGGKKN